MANETRIFRIPPNMPVQAVASHVDHYLRANQGLQVQGASNGEECVLQCRQEKDGWKTVSGMRLATTVQITRTAPDNINVTIGISEWSDKIGAGVAGMLLFWPLAVTAGIGAYKQKKLPEEIFRCIENYLISSTRPGQAPQQNASGFAPNQQAAPYPSDYASGNDGSNRPAGSSSSAASSTDLSKLSDCMRAGKPLLQSLRCTTNQTDLPILWRRHHCRK